MKTLYQVSPFFFVYHDVSNSITEDGLYPCPLECGLRMKEAAMFSHVGVCTGQKPPSPAKPTVTIRYVDTTG